MDSLLIDDIINYACERHKLRLLRTRVRLPPAPPLMRIKMKTTIPKLRRMIRKVITESKYEWMNKPRGARPWCEKESTTVPQKERDAYMDWRWSDDEDNGLRGDESDEPYDQERVDRMIMFLDDMDGDGRIPEFEYDEDAIFHRLQGEFPDASEEEIAEAMASY